jgi:DNA repair exonuclease SbcCD nuclease subunit
MRSIWLVGNHDVIEDGSGSHTMSGFAGALTFEDELNTIQVLDRPCVRLLRQDLLLVALPYVARSHAYDPAQYIRELDDLGCRRVIVIGHLNLEGIEPGSETKDMPRGRDVFWPIAEIRTRWGDRALMLGGHYHEQQEYEGVHIVGSLERLTFGEEKNEPGYFIVEVC